IGAGLLITLGINTWEERKKGSLLEFRTPVPPRISSTSWIKKIKNLQFSLNKPVFQRVEIEVLSNLDWRKSYQKYLKPFDLPLPPHTFEQPIKIIPHTKKNPHPPGSHLKIRAELAFGTGTHPSTHLAAYFLQEILYEFPKASVLDAGCGTAILSMVARLRHASVIWGVDIDPEAILIAKKNIKENNLKGIRLAQSWSQVKRNFDIVVANMIQTKLIKLKPQLIKKIRKGGFLVLSGLTYRDVPTLLKEFSFLSLVERKNSKGWAGLKFQNS
ncbi:MAG: 50S ribosomal protein L11 methyltransferase, partial [bacterium]|nr:50S ribosomal protein L11 methyltransferase [bacterium]